LWDGAAGGVLRMFVFVIRPWPVTELVTICHTQVLTRLCTISNRIRSIAFVFVSVYCFILATIFFVSSIVAVPALNSEEKMKVLNIIITYYKLHINNFKELKSLDIIRNTYN
jgi:hypothetical protein